jgi:hypothetical protein
VLGKTQYEEKRSTYNVRAIDIVQHIHNPQDRHESQINLPQQLLLGIAPRDVIRKRNLQLLIFLTDSQFMRRRRSTSRCVTPLLESIVNCLV